MVAVPNREFVGVTAVYKHEESPKIWRCRGVVAYKVVDPQANRLEKRQDIFILSEGNVTDGPSFRG